MAHTPAGANNLLKNWISWFLNNGANKEFQLRFGLSTRLPFFLGSQIYRTYKFSNAYLQGFRQVEKDRHGGLRAAHFNFPNEGPVEIRPKGKFFLTQSNVISTRLDLRSQGSYQYFIPSFSHPLTVPGWASLCTRFYGAK